MNVKLYSAVIFHVIVDRTGKIDVTSLHHADQTLSDMTDNFEAELQQQLIDTTFQDDVRGTSGTVCLLIDTDGNHQFSIVASKLLKPYLVDAVKILSDILDDVARLTMECVVECPVECPACGSIHTVINKQTGFPSRCCACGWESTDA